MGGKSFWRSVRQGYPLSQFLFSLQSIDGRYGEADEVKRGGVKLGEDRIYMRTRVRR